MNEKEFRLRNSPPAAGRASGIFLSTAVRSPRSVFYFIGALSYEIKNSSCLSRAGAIKNCSHNILGPVERLPIREQHVYYSKYDKKKQLENGNTVKW